MKFTTIVIRAFIIPYILFSQAYSMPAEDEAKKNGRLITCLVFSMHTIPLLKELEQTLKNNPQSQDVKASLDAVGGKPKIPLALFDAELIIETISKKISDKHIININEKLESNPMWILANNLYSETMKNKSFNERFSKTFTYTQSCIDEFIQGSP